MITHFIDSLCSYLIYCITGYNVQDIDIMAITTKKVLLHVVVLLHLI